MYFSGSIRNDSNHKTFLFLALACGFDETITRLTRNITSPGWPGKYRNYENCIWRLQSHGLPIEIVFHVFDLEATYDFVAV